MIPDKVPFNNLLICSPPYLEIPTKSEVLVFPKMLSKFLKGKFPREVPGQDLRTGSTEDL